MPTWEYKTFTRSFNELLTDAELNQLGGQGFELVTGLVAEVDLTVVGRREKHLRVHYIFKRPKPKA